MNVTKSSVISLLIPASTHDDGDCEMWRGSLKVSTLIKWTFKRNAKKKLGAMPRKVIIYTRKHIKHGAITCCSCSSSNKSKRHYTTTQLPLYYYFLRIFFANFSGFFACKKSESNFSFQTWDDDDQQMKSVRSMHSIRGELLTEGLEAEEGNQLLWFLLGSAIIRHFHGSQRNSHYFWQYVIPLNGCLARSEL